MNRFLLGLAVVSGALLSDRSIALGAAPQFHAADPSIGRWELNVSKSKFNPGPAPKRLTRIIEPSWQSTKHTAKGIDAQGKRVLVSFSANYDGKDYPVTGGILADSISFKRLNRLTTAFVQKKAGRIVAVGLRFVSQDGKTMTVTSEGTNLRGQAFSDVAVFDRK